MQPLSIPYKPQLQKVAAPIQDGISFLNIKQILFLKAERSYTKIYLLNNEDLLVCQHLKKFDELIHHPDFFRSHRSYLVNLAHVEKFSRRDGGGLVMANGMTVGISKDRRDAFFEAMQLRAYAVPQNS